MIVLLSYYIALRALGLPNQRKPCAAAVQDERESAAKALVEALVNSQQQHDTPQRSADMHPGGSLEQQEGGNRQQRMEQCLNCCSPVMVSLQCPSNTQLLGSSIHPQVNQHHAVQHTVSV